MSSVISMFIIILISLAISCLLNRSIFETFAFTLFGMITIIYILGIFGALTFSSVLFACLGACALLYLILQKYQLLNQRYRRSIHFGRDEIIVISGVALIGLFAINRKVTDMDSFEQWAYIVKKMYLTGSLHSAQGQYSSTALYPPGIALIQYFVGSYESAFSESTLFIGKNMLGFALLLPLFGQSDQNNWKSLLFLVPIAIFLPFTEYSTFDSSLAVDPLLGLLFGYLVLYGVTSTRTNWFFYINLALGSFVLSLTKTTGFLFCSFVVFIVLFLKLADRISSKRIDHFTQKSIRWLLPSLWIITAAFLGAVSWVIYVRSSGAEIAQYSLSSLSNGLAQYQKETIVNFLNAAFTHEGGAGLNSLSPILWIFAVPGISVVVVRLISSDISLRRRSAIGAVVFTLAYLIWMLCLLIGYLTSFVEGEAMSLAAFSRYLSSYQLGVLLICAVWIAEAIRSLTLNIRQTILALLVCLIAFITPLRSVFDATVGSPYANGKTQDWRSLYNCNKYYEELDVNTTKICYLDQNAKEPGFSFAMYQFEALPYDVQKAVAWRLGEPYYEQDYYSQAPTAAEWEAALIDGGFTHLYLRNINSYFTENYASLFDNPNNIKSDAYYKIDMTNGHARFVYIDS